MGAETGRELGMPVDAFIEEAYTALQRGEDQIVIGAVGAADDFHAIIDKRRVGAEKLYEMIKAREQSG